MKHEILNMLELVRIQLSQGAKFPLTALYVETKKN